MNRLLVLVLIAACAHGALRAPLHSSPRKYGSLITPSGGTITAVTAGDGLTGGGAAGPVTVNVGAGSGVIVSADAVSADTSYVQKRIGGSCIGTNAIQTVNADGSVVCVAAGGGGGGGGTVTSVATGTGLTGGPITTTGTVALANTAVTAGSYTLPAITVDAQGRLTAASNYAGTSCGAGTAIQLLSAAGAASCVTVGTGTVTSVGTTPPITGGPITNGGTIGFNETSNFRTSGGALDLSTAVVMPGSLSVPSGTTTVTKLVTTPTDLTLGGGVLVDQSWTGPQIEISCAVDSEIAGIVAGTAGQEIGFRVVGSSPCVFDDESSSETTPANRITTPKQEQQKLYPGDGGMLKYDGTNARWGFVAEAKGIIANTCAAGYHFSGVDSWGNYSCTADAPANGITGTLTSPDLVAATGTGSVGNYAGSTATACTSGSVVTDAALSAAGVLSLTCGVTPITGTLTSGKIPKATGTNTLGDSDIDLDDGTSVGFFTGGSNGIYIDSNSLNFAYSNATDATGWINFNGALNGTLHFRTLSIGNGKEAAIATFNGSSKLAEFFGPAQIDGAPTLGTSWSNTTTNNGQPKCTGTTTTVTGTGATIVGTNCSGIITLGSSLSTFTLNFDASHPWTNTPPCVFEYVASGSDAHWVSAQSTTAVTVHFASATTGSVNYQCGWGY